MADVNLLVLAGNTGDKFWSKMEPLVNCRRVGAVLVASKRPAVQAGLTSLHPPVWLQRWTPLAEVWRLGAALWALLTRRVDGIIGVYMFPHGLEAALLGWCSGKPVCQMVIGDDLRMVSRRRVFRAAVRRAAWVVTRGPRGKAALSAMGIPEARISHPPNVYTFPDPVVAEAEEKRDYDFIYVGNFSPVKRIDVLLAALAQAKACAPQVRLAFLGSPAGGESYRRRAATLGLADNIDFVGYQSDVYVWLRRARAFVLTSEFEGLPMAMVEAMACGLPCVVPDVSEIPTLARHEENALLVPPGDAAGFGRAMIRLLEDPSLRQRLGRAAAAIRQTQAEAFSLPAVTAEWDAILDHLFPD